jgi:small subunit ribosomal protein S15
MEYFMIDTQRKQEIIARFQQGQNDTGSLEVQVAVLTERINYLNEHLKKHPHEYASRTGLMKMVGRRRSFLAYLKKNNKAAYESLISQLNLRG